jgi:O-antigen ligase
VLALILLPTWPKRHRRVAYLLLAGAVGLLWLVLPSLLSEFGQLFSQIGAESSSASRISAYSAAGPFIAQHPWFGQGFQTFFPQVYFFVDNQYLTSLIETGVAGLGALLALFGTGWVLARRARRAAAGERVRDLMQSLAAAVAAAAVSFATFDALSFGIASGLTFLVLGCVGAAWRLAGRA